MNQSVLRIAKFFSIRLRRKAPTSTEEQTLLNAVDEIYTARPFYGQRKIRAVLARDYEIFAGRDRIRSAMHTLGIAAVYPTSRKNLSIASKNDRKYPYLLKGLVIAKPNAVWGTDITYIRLTSGFAYLAAILDWYSRYVVGFAVSNSPDVTLCMAALEDALSRGAIPAIHNNDQGSTYTATAYTEMLAAHHIRISMDGRGRCMDNIFTERLWRSVKYENVFIMGYQDVASARVGLADYFAFYNAKRPHQSLGYKTPADLYLNR